MPIQGYVLDEDLGQRLLALLRRYETEPRLRPAKITRLPFAGVTVLSLRVVAATLVGPGSVIWYTAKVEAFDADTGEWADDPNLTEVWLVQRHNFGLRPGQ